jgi:uncharacterized protein YndB with AHSA1/START domain
MTPKHDNDRSPVPAHTAVNRKSERELIVTRTFNAPARIVFQAWSDPELFRRWWIPKAFGMTIVACEMDVRTGGSYRLQITPPGLTSPWRSLARTSKSSETH